MSITWITPLEAKTSAFTTLASLTMTVPSLLGYSTYIEACGIAPSQAVGSLGAGVGLWESAEVRVNPTGSVEVLTGCHAHGQGHETTFAQLVSEWLGRRRNRCGFQTGTGRRRRR